MVSFASQVNAQGKWCKMMKIQRSEEWGQARIPQQGSGVVLLHWASNPNCLTITCLMSLAPWLPLMHAPIFPPGEEERRVFFSLQLKQICSCTESASSPLWPGCQKTQKSGLLHTLYRSYLKCSTPINFPFSGLKRNVFCISKFFVDSPNSTAEVLANKSISNRDS